MCTKFLKIQEPLQKLYRRQKGDMKPFPYRGPTRFRRNHTKFSHAGSVALGIYAPLIKPVIYINCESVNDELLRKIHQFPFSVMWNRICTLMNIADTNMKGATQHLTVNCQYQIQSMVVCSCARFWSFAAVQLPFPPSRMWCCITGRSVGIFWDSMMMSSSRVECLHWTLRSLKVRPLGCLERLGTNRPVTLPRTRLTGTLSCWNWTDERTATPILTPIL
jgi:hypothetical protein